MSTASKHVQISPSLYEYSGQVFPLLLLKHVSVIVATRAPPPKIERRMSNRAGATRSVGVYLVYMEIKRSIHFGQEEYILATWMADHRVFISHASTNWVHFNAFHRSGQHSSNGPIFVVRLYL